MRSRGTDGLTCDVANEVVRALRPCDWGRRKVSGLHSWLKRLERIRGMDTWVSGCDCAGIGELMEFSPRLRRKWEVRCVRPERWLVRR